MTRFQIIVIVSIVLAGCNSVKKDLSSAQKPFVWANANVYFLLVDRFANGDTTNDLTLGRKRDGGALRNFEGGDLQGIINKIEVGYFDELGINTLWFNPVFEQIHGAVDEGQGLTYGYHGYWIRDWTAVDPNFGTMDDLKKLVNVAHAHGIRILLDVVLNHTGPVTDVDAQYPDSWVRTSPKCSYLDKETTVNCTLVDNLPDVLTSSNEEVELPDFLIEKWKREGRLDQELAELKDFFSRTGLPRAPRFYIMKWLTDYVREMGIDGYRVDTAKHTEASVWGELAKLAKEAFAEWKINNPSAVLDDQEFFMLGEVYGYSLGHGENFGYDEGDSVNFYQNGFDALINFSLRSEAGQGPEKIFRTYSNQLQQDLPGKTVMNYMDSHDDDFPFDKLRERPFYSALMLLLTPGMSQIYYGDEVSRPLEISGVLKDANLRSNMPWNTLEDKSEILNYYQKLGTFRQKHPAIGAGIHEMIAESPYVFSRKYASENIEDKVVVVLNYQGEPVNVSSVFGDTERLVDHYSGEKASVKNGMVQFPVLSQRILLLESI